VVFTNETTKIYYGARCVRSSHCPRQHGQRRRQQPDVQQRLGLEREAPRHEVRVDVPAEQAGLKEQHARRPHGRSTAVPWQDRLADQRLYSQKNGLNRGSASDQSESVLVQALVERHPDLGSHVNDVARLAEEVATRLGVDESVLQDIRRAAEASRRRGA
jgi:HD-GYP domain-containing protein (c-di-GMP phosphodiesterase class II)